MTFSIRPALAADQPHIASLVRGERIKPTGLHWPKFLIAEEAGRIIGAVQLRHHRDGARELGTLVVSSAFRRRGVGAQLVERRLAGTTGRVFIITGRSRAGYFARWGFRPIPPRAAAPCVRLNYWLGYLGGGLIALIRRRAVNHLAIYERS